MTMTAIVPVLRSCARVGKLGLFLALFAVLAWEVIMKVTAVGVDTKALVAAALPFVIGFAVLAAGSEIAARIIMSSQGAQRD